MGRPGRPKKYIDVRAKNRDAKRRLDLDASSIDEKLEEAMAGIDW